MVVALVVVRPKCGVKEEERGWGTAAEIMESLRGALLPTLQFISLFLSPDV